MTKWDWNKTFKYLGLGAGAVIAPYLVNKVAFIADLLVKTPLLNYNLGGIATVGGILVASLGVMGVDMLINR